VPKKVFYAIFGCWTGIQRASKCELCVLLVRSSPGGWGGGRQRGWLPVSKGQMVQFSGNLAVVIGRTRALHGSEHAHPRSLFFTAIFFLSVVDYNLRALQKIFSLS